MGYYAGLDVSLKRTAVCIVDDGGAVVWEGWADTHPELIFRALKPWADDLYPSGVGRLPGLAYICESRFVNVELRG